jgi:hypothetical protein
LPFLLSFPKGICFSAFAFLSVIPEGNLLFLHPQQKDKWPHQNIQEISQCGHLSNGNVSQISLEPGEGVSDYNLLTELNNFCHLSNQTIVLVTINAARLLILLAMQRCTILVRQVTIVLRTHTALFAIDPALLALQPARLPCSQLTAADTIANAPLLVALALVDVIVVSAWRRCLCKTNRWCYR